MANTTPEGVDRLIDIQVSIVAARGSLDLGENIGGPDWRAHGVEPTLGAGFDEG